MLSLFDDPSPSDEPTSRRVMMSDSQRATIRALFASLGVHEAQLQFDLVAEVTGVRIAAVAELDGATAHRAIERLQLRIANRSRQATGNSWDDRTEDTWIDRL